MRARTALLCLLPLLGCGDDVMQTPPPPAPLGSVAVTWAMEDEQGQPLSCDDLRLSGVEVLRGAEPTMLNCDLGETKFDMLSEGIYPIIVRLKRGAAIVEEKGMNVEVVGGQVARADFVFSFNVNQIGETGNVTLHWNLDLRDPMEACADFGAVSVRITTDQDSVFDGVDETLDCELGEVTFEMLPIGFYEFTFELLDAAGDRLAINFLQAVVETDMTVDAGTVNLTTPNPDRARLLTRWTINSSIAADACDMVGADSVTVEVFAPPPQVSLDPITSSCAPGMLQIDDIRDEGYFNVRVEMFYNTGVSVTSTTVFDVELAFGTTATISVDLQAQ